MVSNTEMNEFVKHNPEFAEKFYKEMKKKYCKDDTLLNDENKNEK